MPGLALGCESRLRPPSNKSLRPATPSRRAVNLAQATRGCRRQHRRAPLLTKETNFPPTTLATFQIKTKLQIGVEMVFRVFFITESDFSGSNSENRASSGATLMQRKLAIG
ncbi:hypothetical protein K0M31_008331 [Melipona bicolor]|uniref:Uncharacterized protein n=1 Tax=Melipona bicolor TaxID=60889 RepID=A0AA40FQS8_9HYME|nr:hypothetical protein K0M31_008331 [Melipona bicolor]